MNPFHYAFKVKDIESTRTFYKEILGCTEGRSTDHWIDFDFFGNQISAHINNNRGELDYCGKVADIEVPIPHFGCILQYDQFRKIEEQLSKYHVQFIIKPYTRYEGQTGEQLTMFVLDYSGNPLEFKAFRNQHEIFAS